MSGGARFDHRNLDGKQMMFGNDVKFEAFNKKFSNVSGSAGISYEASKSTVLKINIARGFRAPALAELSSNGAHEGTNRFEVGNKNLKSETSIQLDAGAEINTEHVSMGASIYYNNISHFIYYRKLLNQQNTDSIIINPETGKDLSVFTFNQQRATLYGFEFNMDIHPHPLDWLHFENTVSFTKARFSKPVDGVKNVPNIPAARYIAELKGTLMPKGKLFRNVYASIESDYTFQQKHPFTGYHTETATPGYWLVNAAIGTNMVNKKGNTVLSIHLMGSNLGNVAYQNHLSRLKYTDVNLLTGRLGVFDMGRSLGIKVDMPLEFMWK